MDYYDSNDNQYKDGQGNGKNNGKYSRSRPVRQPNGTATASLICGIIGTLSLCACIAFPLSIIWVWLQSSSLFSHGRGNRLPAWLLQDLF